MKTSRLLHLAGAMIAATVYLLAASPAFAEFTLIPLSNSRGAQAVQQKTSVATMSSVTADITFCQDTVGAFAIRGQDGTPFSVQTFQVTQTVSGVLGFSKVSREGPFFDTIEVTVTLGADGTGQSDPFYIKGANLGQTVFSACSPQICTLNQVSALVVNVTALKLEGADSPLDTNPNPGGGLRMFPDKTTPGDTVNRRTVHVKATLSSEIATIPIYFQSFDVDDPSANGAPVDRNDVNGAQAGNDNRGTPQAGTLSAASAKTDASGVTQVDLTVTMQPGDNFRIAATCNSNYFSGVVVNGTDLKDGSGSTLPTQRVNVTDMLTVWRRVHVEVDSMGPVTGNRVTGTIRRARPDAATQLTEIAFRGHLEPSRFKGGLMTIAGIGAGTVFDNTRNTVTIHGLLQNADAAGRSFELVDDDDFNTDDGTALDGDTGENLPAPDTTLAQDSDNPTENAFAPAYIRPTYDIGDNNDLVGFVANVADDTPAAKSALYDFDNQATEASTDFWTVYLLGAYQFTTSWDGDPDGENPLGIIAGVVDNINGMGASVFNELIRPREAAINNIVNHSSVAAHELGHLFNGEHNEGGLMDTLSRSFSDTTLEKIRTVTHP